LSWNCKLGVKKHLASLSLDQLSFGYVHRGGVTRKGRDGERALQPVSNSCV
jgi:hypothetical protein